jgi:hypothetical protein
MRKSSPQGLLFYALLLQNESGTGQPTTIAFGNGPPPYFVCDKTGMI